MNKIFTKTLKTSFWGLFEPSEPFSTFLKNKYMSFLYFMMSNVMEKNQKKLTIQSFSMEDR